jgi:DedD protein
MRTLFDTEEEEEVKASEITLSTASLLGIFFGLVLICGVFFGFGYSMGRGTGQGAQAHALENIPASNAGDGDDSASAGSPPAAALPPAAAPEEQPASAKAASAPVVKPVVKEDSASEDDTPVKPVPLAISKPTALKSVPAYVPPADAPVSPSGRPMVQIAAVARPEDADVLVSALRQRGYGVVVRNEPQDKLLHVQVGPFADRTQAAAMKQKLLSDGYNAIIKQ